MCNTRIGFHLTVALDKRQSETNLHLKEERTLLGLLLKDVRMIKDIRPKKLIEGTSCTANMLKKYENGMTQFEKLLGMRSGSARGNPRKNCRFF